MDLRHFSSDILSRTFVEESPLWSHECTHILRKKWYHLEAMTPYHVMDFGKE